MNRTISVLCLLCSCRFPAKAQGDYNSAKQKIVDSIKRSYVLTLSVKSPLLRQGYISTDIIGSGTVNFKMNDQQLFKGKMRSFHTNANITLPVVAWKNKSLNVSIGQSLQYTGIDNITSYNSRLAANSYSFNRNTIALSVSCGGTDSLLGRPVIYTGSITMLSDNLIIMRKISATGLLLFPLKRTATSSLSIGGILIVDPTSKVPFVPFVSYWKKLEFQDLELFIDLPKRAVIRKQLNAKFSSNIGVDLTPQTSFFDFDAPGEVPSKVIYNTVGLKTGIGVEYRLSKYVILGFNGGMYSTISSKMFNQDKWFGNAFITSTTATAPYCNVSLFLLPLINPLFK